MGSVGGAAKKTRKKNPEKLCAYDICLTSQCHRILFSTCYIDIDDIPARMWVCMQTFEIFRAYRKCATKRDGVVEFQLKTR